MTDDTTHSISEARRFLDGALRGTERISRDGALEAAQAHATIALACALRDLTAELRGGRLRESLTGDLVGPNPYKPHEGG